MKFQKQKYMHDPDNGIVGDCYRTVVACFLDTDRDKVPHFYQEWDSVSRKTQEKAIEIFLASQGYYRYITIGANTLKGTHEKAVREFGNDYYAICGKSKLGTGHIVICQGGKIVHDPSLINSGIVGPLSSGLYFIQTFSKLVSYRESA